jgi:glutathione S-transferase
MKLYYKRGACSLTARIFAHELNLSCDYEAVDLQTKKTETGADFLVINFKGSVPALVLQNKEVLTENAVILQYLADMHNAIQYLPAIGDMKRYRVLEWLNFCSTDLHGGCGPFFNSKISTELQQEVFLPILKRKVAVAEKQLATHAYIAGEQFSLADIYLFVVFTWFPHIGLELGEWPHVAKYFDMLKNRKAIQQALKEEGLI